MTARDWLACPDPGPMLQFLHGWASDRKLRLFGVACCRKVPHLLTRRLIQQAIDAADARADDSSQDQALARINDTIETVMGRGTTQQINWELDGIALRIAAGVTCPDPWVGACNLADGILFALAFESEGAEDGNGDATANGNATMHRQEHPFADILREVINPFDNMNSKSHRHMPAVTEIANRIYEVRAFDRMPILGDALEDAGCTDADILNHCREPGEHVRGCWVVDLLLAKE